MTAKRVSRLFKTLSIAICLLYFTACKQSSYSEKIAANAVAISEKNDALPVNPSKNVNSPQTSKKLMIIKKANLKFKVKNVKVATNSIKKLAFEYNGYISELSFVNNSYSLENRFTVKIPQQHFDKILDSIVKIAEFVDYENISTEDVTEQYIDIRTRLATKLEVKERYEVILRKNVKTVEDILATEEKLTSIQEEIEATEGKLKYMANKVAYSTLQIDLYESVNYKDEPESYTKTFWSKSKDGLAFGWNLLEAVFLGLIYIWPLFIVGIPLLFLLKRNLKEKKKR